MDIVDKIAESIRSLKEGEKIETSNEKTRITVLSIGKGRYWTEFKDKKVSLNFFADESNLTAILRN